MGKEIKMINYGFLKKFAFSFFLIILVFLAAFSFDPILEVIFGVRRAVVTKKSMLPTLKEGDLVIIKHTPQEEIKMEDIVVFDKYILGTPSKPGYEVDLEPPWIHRIIDIIQYNNTYFFKTKGDNNISQDPGLIPYNAIIGKLIFVIPLIGSIYINPLFRMINIILILFLIVFYIYIELKEEKK